MESVALFGYTLSDINQSLRRTNSLLRGINNVRLLIGDIQDVIRRPSVANIFWTIVQLSRFYNTIRRLQRLIAIEVNDTTGMLGWMQKIAIPVITGDINIPTGGIDLMMGLGPMEMRIEAFRENIPMKLEGIDLSMIPEEAQEALQKIFEEDAALTAEDARRILRSRIIYPESSTGFLESSIGWMPDTMGARVYAGAPYAWWVEEGQRTFTGHHYLRDAVEESKLRLPDKIRAELDRLFKGKT
jgi:hypothetical protein